MPNTAKALTCWTHPGLIWPDQKSKSRPQGGKQWQTGCSPATCQSMTRAADCAAPHTRPHNGHPTRLCCRICERPYGSQARLALQALHNEGSLQTQALLHDTIMALHTVTACKPELLQTNGMFVYDQCEHSRSQKGNSARPRTCLSSERGHHIAGAGHAHLVPS